MSRMQKVPAGNAWEVTQSSARPVLIMEKQLINTLELQWCVQRVRIRSNGATSTSSKSLFNGMVGELQTFTALIRKRLECWGKAYSCVDGVELSSYGHPFFVRSIAAPEQFETLLWGYGHYSRQTLEAIESLRRSDDLESAELLALIAKAVERDLLFLEICLEQLALKP